MNMRVFVVVLVLGMSPALPARDLYVATNGNDGWSGTLAAANASRTDGPFASVERARDEIRKYKGAKPGEAVRVLIRAGVYEVARTFRLEAQDSGKEGAPIVYGAYPGEKPVLIGGRQVTGWKPDKGQIMAADVTAFKGVYFRQLIFDGQRQQLARYPNYDPQNPYGGGWAYADGKVVPMYSDVPGEDRRTLHYKASDARVWANPAEGEINVFARYNWWNNIVRMAAVDGEKRIIRLAGDCSYAIRPGDRYFLRNLREELDAPGEWYLDKKTSTLHFWPPGPMAGKAVYAPTTRTIVELGAGTRNVTFRGLTFECSEGTAIEFRETTNCLVAGCTIRNVGDYHGSGVTISGGSNNGVKGCDIFETGSHGVSLSGGDQKKLTASGNYADNNYIHHVGVFYKQGVGISMSGVGARATHNLIHDGPRMGIMFGGNRHLIEFNHIRHVNLETEDTGAVYTGGRDWLGSRGTVIRYNYFHDILGYGRDADGTWKSPHFSWGVYLDDNAGGVDVIGNIVARAQRAGLHLHNGRDNLIENNVFIDSKLQQVEYNGWTPTHSYWGSHLPTMIKGYESVMNEPAWKGMRNMHIHPTNAVTADGKIMTGNVFRRNIIYYHEPKSKLWSFRNVPFDHYVSDSNLVWHFNERLLTGELRPGRELTGNLFTNGGFEGFALNTMPAGWWWQGHPSSSAAVVTDETSGAGRQCLRLDGGQSKDEKGNEQKPSIGGFRVPGKPGSYYRLTAKLKASKPGAKATLAGQSHIPNVYFWIKDTGLTVGPEWKDYQVVFKLPAEGESGWHKRMTNVEVSIHFREADGSLFVDDLSLKEVATMDEWASWQGMGFDRNTIVADPLFVAPEKDDYRLQRNSPAFKIGFQAIPIEKIGPYRGREPGELAGPRGGGGAGKAAEPCGISVAREIWRLKSGTDVRGLD